MTCFISLFIYRLLEKKLDYKYTTSNKLHTFVATRNKYNMDTSFIDGSKTGFTYDAGLCLASTSHYNDVNLLLVTANAPYNNKLNRSIFHSLNSCMHHKTH